MNGYLQHCRRCRRAISYAEREPSSVPRVVITVQETGFFPKSVELCKDCRREFIQWVNDGVKKGETDENKDHD